MKALIRITLASLSFLTILGVYFADGRKAAAAGGLPPGPDRYISVTEEYTAYVWWVASWSDSSVACQVEVDHPGIPTSGEVYAACGDTIYNKWIVTQPCTTAAIDPQSCSGYYLHLVNEKPAIRQVPSKLPPAVVWVTLDGCIPYQSTFQCEGVPKLVLTGEEPLSGYSILRLEGSVDEAVFTCDPICQVDLGPTDEDGLLIKFWAYSSYGDSSEVFSARVRVASLDDDLDPYLYVDVLTSQWRGVNINTCAQNWNIFPPRGGITGWLASPDTPEELASNIAYEYLAGNLISQGLVDVSRCADGGLLENGYASACGADLATAIVEAWQNQFDDLIFSAAQEAGIPAQVLKNLFSRESQFWPGMTSQRPEAGLGQLTDNGADATLLWNRPFYEQFCTTVFGEETCDKGYPHLPEEQKAILRGALVNSVDAFCADCALGIDLDKAEASISIFAETLVANCAQAGMVLDLNYPNQNPPPSYEDLWRFTLVNYNAGPGCLGLAVNATSSADEPLDWENVSSHLTTACEGANDYVNDISSSVP